MCGSHAVQAQSAPGVTRAVAPGRLDRSAASTTSATCRGECSVASWPSSERVSAITRGRWPGDAHDAEVGEREHHGHVVDERVVGRRAVGADACRGRARGRQHGDARRERGGADPQLEEVVVGGVPLPDPLQHTGGDAQQLGGVGCARPAAQALDDHGVAQLVVDPGPLRLVRGGGGAVLLAAAHVVADEVAEQHQRRQQAEEQVVPGAQEQGERHGQDERDDHRHDRHPHGAARRRGSRPLERDGLHGRDDPRRPVDLDQPVAHDRRGLLRPRHAQLQGGGAHQQPRPLGERPPAARRGGGRRRRCRWWTRGRAR